MKIVIETKIMTIDEIKDLSIEVGNVIEEIQKEYNLEIDCTLLVKTS